jgi:ABC-type transporter Mla subunit MlaD
MAEPKNTFKLGLTVIVMGVLFFATAVFVGRGVSAGEQTFVVRYPADEITTQLKPGSIITCGGQTVGTVTQAELHDVEEEGAATRLYVFITCGIDRDVDLRMDCDIVPGEPLLGEVGKLVIRNRGAGARVTADAVVDGRVSPSLNAAIGMLAQQLDPNDPKSLLSMIKNQLDPEDAHSLIAKIHLSLSDLNEVTRNISLQLNPGQRNVLITKIHAVLDNINAATAAMRNQLDPNRDEVVLSKVHAALDSLNEALATVVATLDENREPINETVLHIRDTAETLDDVVAARVAAQLDVRNAASLIAKVHTGVDRLNASLEDLNEITDTTRAMIDENDGLIGKAVANFTETSAHLKAAAKEIYRNPWRLLYKPSPEEVAQMSVLDAARAFSEAASQLDSATLRLKGLIEAEGGALPTDDPQLIAIREDLQHTVGQFREAEAALWNQLKLQ